MPTFSAKRASAIAQGNKALATTRCLFAALVYVTPFVAAHAAGPDGDALFVNGHIATADPALPQASAMVIRDGRIFYIGDDAGARSAAARGARATDLHGRRVLPGLVDAHIHPVGIVATAPCDLESQARTLAQIAAFVRSCVQRHPAPKGTWLNVAQWNFSEGNATDARHPSLRKALDLAAPDRPVQLLGNDGHHGAFNSAALALAKDASGRTVGYSAVTLAVDFAQMRQLIGVDASGEPDGGVNEDARDAMGAPDDLELAAAALARAPTQVARLLNASGITAVLDAVATPGVAAVYDALQARGELSLRANLAIFQEPEKTRGADGSIDYDRLVDSASAMRARYAANPLIRADTIKIFADGVLEGNPLATPPTLPEAPVLRPYLQPIFTVDAKGRAQLHGYVEPDSAGCRSLQAADTRLPTGEAAAAFEKTFGFQAAQCLSSDGRLQHAPEVIAQYARRMHAAGFTLHIHAIGDRAVHVALDAIEGARAGDSQALRPDTLAHVQLVSPEDVQRIGRDHLFLAMTYAWMYTDPEYDAQVIPFIDRVKDLSFASLHDPRNYYEQQAYPIRALRDAGAVAVAGSDAPVDTRDPRPFINMQMAVTRAHAGVPALSPGQALTLEQVFRAYTIDGARSLGREDEIGSLAVGKSADFVILDRDIFSIPIESVGKTRVLQTWFQGRKVYAARANPHAMPPARG